MTAHLLVPALLAWLAGVAWQLQSAELLAVWQQAALVGVALVLWGVQRWLRTSSAAAVTSPARSAFVVLLAITALALLAFASTDWRAARYRAGALASALEGRDLIVTGRVASLPRQGESGVRFRFAAEQAELDGRAVQLPALLELGWYSNGSYSSGAVSTSGGVPSLRAGDRWVLPLRLKQIHGTVNPHGFDYELWLWEQGVQATGYVRTTGPHAADAQWLGRTWRHPVERLRQTVRDAVYARLAGHSLDEAAIDAQGLTEARRRAGVVAALVVGDQQAIERSDWDLFRALGLSHLLSISGLHITLFAWLAAALVGRLWRLRAAWCLRYPAPLAARLGGLLLALAYAVFSGWGVPAQRTILMLAIVTLPGLTGRRWPWLPLWLLAGTLVVLIDPWALLQAGFWLSFVAVGVLFVSTERQHNTERRAGAAHAQAQGQGLWRGLLPRLAARLWALLREQGVITLALAPLTLLLFGQVSLVGLLANLVAIPWVTLVVTPLAMLGILAAPLWNVAAWAVHLMNTVLAPLASWPLAVLTVAQAPLWAGAAGLLGALLLVLRLPWSWRLMGLPLLLPVLLWRVPAVAPGQFELLAVDVGQGNAVLVRTAGHVLLYDAGPRYSRESDAGERVLVPLLRALDLRVDRLLLSHRDSDHTGGAAAVLAMQPQADVLSSASIDDGLVLPRPVAPCMAGQSWVWDGVRFDILHPEADDYGNVRRTNALSCVLRISNGVRTALLAGDIEQAQEARLVSQGAPLRADLLLVPHHGSKTSSSAEFLDAVQPTVALVQAGYRNRYGHPAPSVQARYAEHGITLVDSVHCGAARWQSDSDQGVQCERQLRARYWRHAVEPVLVPPAQEPGTKLARPFSG